MERRSDGCLLATASAMTAPLCLPGDYEISVKFNEQHVPDSPFLVAVAAPANDARRLAVTGLQVRHQGPPPPPPTGDHRQANGQKATDTPLPGSGHLKAF